MSQSSRLMDPSGPTSFYLRSTSTVSLHERFSQVLLDQLTRARRTTFDPVQLCAAQPVVLLVKREEPPPPPPPPSDSSVTVKPSVRRRSSVWTRLGWNQVTRRRRAASRLRGFWSFRNKYRWRARTCSTFRRRGGVRSRLRRRRLLMRRSFRKLPAGQTPLGGQLQRGGASASRGRVYSRAYVPSKKQLDAELDDYMSLSKTRLDAELDDYMSLSKTRLDAELDEYMSLAGQAHLLWE